MFVCKGSTLLLKDFKRPTLGPVRNFDIMSGEFVQILHTGRQHWVCISTIQSVPSAVKLYDGLCNDIILDEVKDQAKSILADSFLGIENVPVQQQMGLIVLFFVIAFEPCLVYGLKLENSNFYTRKMRQHLYNCLQNDEITPFPPLTIEVLPIQSTFSGKDIIVISLQCRRFS